MLVYLFLRPWQFRREITHSLAKHAERFIPGQPELAIESSVTTTLAFSIILPFLIHLRRFISTLGAQCNAEDQGVKQTGA